MTRIALSLAAVLVAAPMLSGCASIGDSMAMPSFLGGGSKPQATGEVPDEYRVKPTCPTVEVRNGAEAMTIYETGKTDPGSVRYQASVQRVARDCDITGSEVTVRVGVAGRVAAGPKGGQGVVQVPVRIVVTGADGKPIYSKAHIVPVSVDAPDYTALWTQVDDQVRIPGDVSANASIYVGLDELALKGGAVKPAAVKKKG